MAAFFSSKKESNTADIDNILGHIDEVVSQHLSVLVRCGRQSLHAHLVSIEENDKRIKISCLDEPTGTPNDPVTVGFPLDGTWQEFTAPLYRNQNGLFIGFPSRITARERRANLRSAFSPREEASVALLESFGKGVGIQGTLDNISCDAFCLSVQRAMDLISERDIHFHENLLKTGQEFMLCRLKGIPGLPQIESAGKVVRVARKGRWQLVIEFSKLGGDLSNRLKQFAQSRTMPYQPVNRSYKRKKDLREEMSRQNAPEPPVKTTVTEPKENPPVPVAPQPAQPVPTTAENPTAVVLPSRLVHRLQEGPVIITLGDALKRDLSFLSDLGSHWKPCPTVKEMILTLQTLKRTIMIIPKRLNNQPILEYMEKLAATGAMEHITLFLLADSGLSPSEVAQCKKVKIKRVFPFPLVELEPFLSAILSVQMAD